ncbi:MAG: hypothetical protein K9M49_07225 [Candidatus Marinimicrobia bacterium]|nr:hypothetical protein [Candidatus Neomarinimicrobiota bacterium]MCF7851014.1 hypothetical protein [Candidatus Neomarinimicrobiota bacterium]MCF7904932.1 hypothetical protein [Candidatus Neomarinimicrobiota bacterium]
MKKDLFGNHTINSIVIVFLIILFISVIYIPKTIWDYEAELSDIAHFRMETVGKAEKLHYQLTKTYTSDPEQLLLVVNSVRDSLRAAEDDTNYNYYGAQSIPVAGKTISVNYTDEYKKLYEELHLKLFKQLTPNHHMDAELVNVFLDSVKTLFDAGNYVGEQTMEIDSVSLSFTVSDKYDILYQNIKTSMFNALTSSYTKYPNFSNPLVDAVLDSINKDPELDGRTDFANIYDGSVRIDFIIPVKFEDTMEKTRLELKKNFAIDPYDSATFGDTLYTSAVNAFMTHFDTSGVMPDMLMIMMEDTALGVMVDIPVEVKTRAMKTALNKRRNTLYKLLTGYSEPNPFIAEHVIAVAIDSLASEGVGIDSFYTDIDLSDAVFNVNIHPNIPTYFNQVSLEQAYYMSDVNLTDLNWTDAAVEVVEYVAEKLRGKGEFSKWQIVEAEADTFHVNVFDEFLRRYDNMNIELYKKLTGEYTNRYDYAYDVVTMAEDSAAIDSLNWAGARTIDIAADTILVNVFPLYLSEYDTTFLIPRDTVVHTDDSTFTGVWYRNKLGVVDHIGYDTLAFLSETDNARYRYHFSGTDSVQSFNILEKTDSADVEVVYLNDETFIMVYDPDSLMENLYRVADIFDVMDSLVIDSLNVVSEEFVVGTQEKYLFAEKDSFYGWIDTTVHKKFVKKELFSHYDFVPEHVVCPVTDLPYRITIRDDIHLTIESPITQPIETRRYLFFTQVDSSHGNIEDGEASWAE